MLVVLVLVYLFFMITTGGSIFKPSNFNALITQNAYVYILGCGMLMCMLTGGNIDLSCGAFVCLLGAIGGVLMVVKGLSVGLSIAILLAIAIVYGCGLGYLVAYVNVPPWIATLAGYLAFRGLGTSILSKNSSTGSIAFAARIVPEHLLRHAVQDPRGHREHALPDRGHCRGGAGGVPGVQHPRLPAQEGL